MQSNSDKYSTNFIWHESCNAIELFSGPNKTKFSSNFVLPRAYFLWWHWKIYSGRTYCTGQVKANYNVKMWTDIDVLRSIAAELSKTLFLSYSPQQFVTSNRILSEYPRKDANSSLNWIFKLTDRYCCGGGIIASLASYPFSEIGFFEGF